MLCRVCQVELTEENWSPSQKESGSRICNHCEVKRVTAYNVQHRSAYLQYLKKWRTDNRDRFLRAMKENREYYTKMAIEHYSNGTMACANPYGIHEKPFTILEALDIDHIKGGGTQHRRRVGNNIARWLVKNDYPEGFQVLCANCNRIKRKKNREV